MLKKDAVKPVFNVSEWLESEGILPLLRDKGLQSYEEGLINAVESWNSEFERLWPELKMEKYNAQNFKTIYYNVIGINDDNYAKEALSIVNNCLINNTDKEYKDHFDKGLSNTEALSKDMLDASAMADDIGSHFLEYFRAVAKGGGRYENRLAGYMLSALSKIPESRQKLVLDWTKSGKNEHTMTESDVDDVKCASKIPNIEWNEYVGCLQTVKEFIDGKDAVYKEAFGNVLEKLFDVPESFRKECFEDITEYGPKIAEDSGAKVAKLMESYALVSKVYGIEKLKEARHILKLALDINVDPVQQARKMIYHEKMIPETEKFLDSVKDKKWDVNSELRQ